MKSILRALADIANDIWMCSILALVRFVPGRPGNFLIDPIRRFLVSLIGVEMGSGSQISPGFLVFNFGRFKAGRGCRFGYDFQVWNFTGLSIGTDMLASHGVKIICATHKVNRMRENVAGPVLIGNNVWLGANVTIVGPSRIGDDVIVGANSFVSGDLEAGWIYAGSPARPIRPVVDSKRGEADS